MDTKQDEVEGTLLSERDISEGFDRLIAANRLFGAELNPTIIKKSGKGTRSSYARSRGTATR